MTKNTKANLTLIFCVNKKNADLAGALEAISRQTDKKFNLVIVLNACNPADKNIVDSVNLSGINRVDYIFLSENLGDAYTFDYCLKNNIETKYVYCFDSNKILFPDFVSTINTFLQNNPKTDVLSFFGVPNIYFKDEFISIKTLSDDFCTRPLISYDNKVLNVEFLQKNKIKEPFFKHYPLLFYVQLFAANPVWYSLGRQIFSLTMRQSLSYNAFDLFDQCVEIMSLLDKKEMRSHYSEIEYLCIITLFRNFIYAIFKNESTSLFSQMRILNQVQEFMNINFPNWKQNEWLTSKKNKNNPELLEYLKEFKPKLFHVKKALSSPIFTEGYDKRKK